MRPAVKCPRKFKRRDSMGRDARLGDGEMRYSGCTDDNEKGNKDDDDDTVAGENDDEISE